MIAAEAFTVWQAIAVVGGGTVAGALALTALANIPGGRWIYRQLVLEPMTRFVERRVDVKVTNAIGLERDALRAELHQQVSECVAPIRTQVHAINLAVNNVEGRAPIKDKVHAIQQDVSELRTEVAAAAGKLDTLTGMVESLVRRDP